MVDPALAYGVAGELIDLLLQNPNLQVSSPTSSFYFADSTEAVAVLAERLKVRHLLEACIRTDGENLDLAVRLLDVRQKTPPWSQSFSGPMNEVFVALNQISMHISEAVGQQANRAIPVSRPINPEVWLQLLQGRFFYRERGLENLRRAEAEFQQVLEHVPSYAAAWLGLAQVYLEPTWPGTPTTEGFEQARAAALMALKLEPDLAGAHLILSRVGRIYDWDWPGARQQAQRALSLQAGNADILANASLNEFGFGQFSRAISLLESAISRDPLQLQHLLRLGLAYEFSADYEKALIAYRQLLALNSDYPAAHAYRARVKLAQHKEESALAEADLEQHPFWKRYARILSLIALERHDEATLLLEEMTIENANDAAFQIAEIHAFRGDTDAAFDWLERAIEQRDGGIGEMIGNLFLASLSEDERWRKILSRAGLE